MGNFFPSESGSRDERGVEPVVPLLQPRPHPQQVIPEPGGRRRPTVARHVPEHGVEGEEEGRRVGVGVALNHELVGNLEPDSEEKNFPQNFPENFPEMQF